MKDFVTNSTSDEIVGYTPSNEKEFSKLFGNRIYLEFPKEQDFTVIVDPKTKQELQREFLTTIQRLKVYAVGDSISHIKEGDEVMVDPATAQRALIIDLSENRKVLLVSVFDIVHLW